MTDRDELYQRALARIPGGVSSPVRAFNAVGGTPFFVERAEGAYLVDTDGNRYLDFVQSWGASILGHAHPAIVEAVQRAAAAGTSYGAPTVREVELAEAIAARVPSVQKVRLVSSGTEATMTAVRLARGFTGRAKVLKFAGCYHGHLDALLVAAGSGLATLGIPGSAGVTPGAVADTVVVPFNDVAALDAVFAANGEALAAALVEPVAANMGLVPPDPGFLEHLARRCAEHGALFVCDEVITGFRVGPSGAEGRFGLRPDLSIFGKVIGGGLPLAAVGGRADVMDRLAPLGDVYQAGTLSGNPLATAAGLAALGALEPDSYRVLEARVTKFVAALDAAITGAGVPVQVPRAGTLAGLFFASNPVRSYEDAQAGDHETYARFFHAMLDRGVFLAPSSYEVMFVSLAHTDEDLARTVELAGDAARQVAPGDQHEGVTRPFRFGVSIADAPDRAAWQEQARRAEALGYDVLLAADHLTDSLAPVPALMAAADATTTLRVGSFVMSNDFRHPALVAREATTADLLTDGRFELGLGAGHMKSEYDEVGIPFETAGTRVERLEESVRVVRGLLDGAAVTFAGEHLSIAGHRGYPVRPHVPLLVGGNGSRVLAIAARHADIVSFVGFHQIEGSADVALSHFSAAGLDNRLAVVRAAGGDRFADLELNVLVQRVIVTGDRAGAADELSRRAIELAPETALESPFLLIGTHDQIIEDLLERRDRFGISYVVVFEAALEVLAPVVGELRGR